MATTTKKTSKTTGRSATSKATTKTASKRASASTKPKAASNGKSALITGDLTHHPVQWAEPDWGAAPDSDQAESAATRRRLITEHVDRDTLIVGTHYAPPTAGYLVRRDGGVRFEPPPG